MNIDIISWLIVIIVVTGIVTLFDIIISLSKRTYKEKQEHHHSKSEFIKIAEILFPISVILLSLKMLDFALVLSVLILISGIIWLIDSLFFKAKRLAYPHPHAEEDERNEPVLVEYAKAFFPILLIVLVLRSFLAEPFRIPSGSMEPTLKPHDFILVNKFTYGIRLPVFGTKVIDINEPERGDVMVFRFPKDPAINFIKRVIGLPGDHIRYVNKKLYINGELIAENLSPLMVPDYNVFEETLGNIVHTIQKKTSEVSRGDGEWQVPEGHYFVMGDNRDNSHDSRFWNFVPDKYVVGKAFAVWMHWDISLSLPSFERNGVIE